MLALRSCWVLRVQSHHGDPNSAINRSITALVRLYSGDCFPTLSPEADARQHNLELLGPWQEAAISLGKPASYVERIQAVTASYQRGLPLSEQTIAARQKDLAANPA